MNRELLKGVYDVGARHWSRQLFDEIIPLPDGTTYNSYVVKGSEKTALIDAVDPVKEDELLKNLRELGVKIDYVVANHAEQDHSGGIPAVLEMYPQAKVVTNQKCKDFLVDLLHIPDERFNVIEDGDTLSLGDRTLEFIYAAWVHWPETILTYLREDRILFTCDLFGSHLAQSELYARDECRVLESAKRYYAEIMMPFRNNIKNHLLKLEKYDVNIIAPSHGPVYDKPEVIVDAYKEWVDDESEDEVVLAYVSMHGSTRVMADRFIEQLMRKGVGVKVFNLTTADVGELAMALVDAATVVIACPTFLVGPHPSAVYAAYLVNALRPKTKYIGVMGSYGWGGRTVDVLKEQLKALDAEILEPVLVKGLPHEQDLKEVDALADAILLKHQDNTLIRRTHGGG